MEENPEREGVHLAGESQKRYVEKVLRAAGKLMCRHCAPKRGAYEKAEHIALAQVECKHPL